MLRFLPEEALLYKWGRCAGGEASVISEDGALQGADRQLLEHGDQRT